MPIYIAMLRGINVGGHHRIKMEQLKKSFASLGFDQVRTYIQSGNVVFQAAKASPAMLSRRFEEIIAKDFGFSVSVVIRSEAELSKIIESNPFVNQRGVDLEKLHVTFLSHTPASTALTKLSALTIAPEQSHCANRDIYLHLPNGVADSKLMKVPLDRTLGVVTTTRNWRTVTTLHQMCKGEGKKEDKKENRR